MAASGCEGLRVAAGTASGCEWLQAARKACNIKILKKIGLEEKLFFFKFGGWIGKIIFMVFLHQGIQDFVSSVMSTMFSIAHVSQFVFLRQWFTVRTKLRAYDRVPDRKWISGQR